MKLIQATKKNVSVLWSGNKFSDVLFDFLIFSSIIFTLAIVSWVR